MCLDSGFAASPRPGMTAAQLLWIASMDLNPAKC